MMASKAGCRVLPAGGEGGSVASLPCQAAWRFLFPGASWHFLSPEGLVLRYTNAQMFTEASCVPCIGLLEVTKMFPLEGRPGHPMVSAPPGAIMASGP